MKKSFLVETWMMKDLGLSGNQLIMYAYLHDVTGKGTKSFTGGYTELSGALTMTVPTVYNIIGKLREKGYIEPAGGMEEIRLSDRWLSLK